MFTPRLPLKVTTPVRNIHKKGKAFRQTPPLYFGGKRERNFGACGRTPEDIHNRTPHNEPGRNRYVEPHSPDSGRSRTADRDDKTHGPAQNIPRRPVQRLKGLSNGAHGILTAGIPSTNHRSEAGEFGSF